MKLFRSNNIEDKNNKMYNLEMDIDNVEDFLDCVYYDHIKGEIEGNDRAKDNEFKSGDVVVLDIDNSFSEAEGDWVTIDTWKGKLPGVKQYITPSRNHMVAKTIRKNIDGKRTEEKLPPRPKFHVYLPLSNPCNGEDIQEWHNQLREKFSFLDDAMKKPKQPIFGNKNNSLREDDTHFIDGEYLDEKFTLKKEIGKSIWSDPKNYVGATTGDRYTKLSGKVGYWLARGYTYNTISDMAMELNKTFTPPLGDKEVKTIVSSYGRDIQDPESILERFKKKYSLITSGGAANAIIDDDINQIVKISALRIATRNLKYRPIGGKTDRYIIDDWLESNDIVRYNNIVFEDGIKHGRVNDPVFGYRDYNLWRGFSVEPKASNMADSWLDLTHTIICNGNKEKYEFILNWCADIVQNPTNKRATQQVLVLLGEQGTGKGTFGELLLTIFHQVNVLKTSRREDIFGAFNALLAGKVLVFGDEIEYPGDSQAVEQFKATISDNGEESLRIEKKYIDAIMTKNALRFIMSSNSDWAAKISGRDRRYVVFRVNESRVQQHNYFIQIKKDMENGGAEALLDLLLYRDISNVDWSKPPRDEDYVEQKIYSLNIIERFFHKMIEEWEEGDEPLDFENLLKIDDERKHEEVWSLFKYRNRLQQGEDVLVFKPKEAQRCFEKFIEKYGSSNNRQFDKASPALKKFFIKVLFNGQNYHTRRQMIGGQFFNVITINDFITKFQDYIKQ